MHKQLDEYVKVYRNWYTKDFCEQTVSQLELGQYEKHTFYSPRDNKQIHVGDDFDTLVDSIENSKFIFDETWKIVEQYIVKDLKLEWFAGWEGYTAPKFNRYLPNTKMKEHCDHIRHIFDGTKKGVPILTVLTTFNDDYKGGDLILFTDKKYEMFAGDVVVFPSNFLYPHRVDSVESGTRYSAVSWVC